MSNGAGAIAMKRRSFIVLAAAACLAGARLRAETRKADRILVLKSARVLELWSGDALLKRYPIALGRRPRGAKSRHGDNRTPEGTYYIDRRNRRSVYHRALHFSYPNDDDLARARAAGVDPGGDVLIHGMPEWYGPHDPVRFFRDWTNGCIAVGNTAIEEIWDAVDDGTLVEILP